MKRGRKPIIKINLDNPKPKPIIEIVKIIKNPIIINFD